MTCRQHERPNGELASLRVYEAHVGMSSEDPKVASYTEFKGRPSPKLQICQRHPPACSYFVSSRQQCVCSSLSKWFLCRPECLP